MSLLDMPLFSVQTASGPLPQFMTLEEMVRCKAPGTLDHPWHQLAAPSRGLAHGMLQSVVDSAGLSEDVWLEGVVDGNLDGVANHLFKTQKTSALKGFSLFGDVAFMQMPKDFFPFDAKGESIEGLFQPFKARRSGSAKALRSGQPIQGICPHCAAIGLHCLHAFSGSMARYWGAAPTRGAVVYHLEGASIGQSLLLNVLHGGSLNGFRAAEKRQLPWVADAGGMGGRDADGRAPFEKHLSPSQQITHPAQGMHPFIRSCRLVEPEPGDLGQCDTCGRNEMPMVRRFILQSENEVLKALSPKTMTALKLAAAGEAVGASGIVSKTLSRKFIHPALARVQFNPKNDDGAEKNPVRIQQVSGGTEGLSSTTPTWLHLVEALGAGLTSMPPVMQQYLCSIEAQQALSPHIKLGMFGVQFVGALNPNPKFILDTVQGASNFMRSKSSTAEVAQAADGIAVFVKKLLDGWVSGAEKLEWTAERTPLGLRLKAPDSVNRRKYARTTALNDPILQTLSACLWTHATKEVGALAQAIASAQAAHSIEGQRSAAQERLRIQATSFWVRFLQHKASTSGSMEEHFMEAAANDAFFRFIAPKSIAKKPQSAIRKANC